MNAKHQVWNMLDLPGKEEWEKDPLGNPRGMLSSGIPPIPSGHPIACRLHLPRLFQLLLAFNMMKSQCHMLNVESGPGLSTRLRGPALLWGLWWASCQLLPVTSQGRP